MPGHPDAPACRARLRRRSLRGSARHNRDDSSWRQLDGLHGGAVRPISRRAFCRRFVRHRVACKLVDATNPEAEVVEKELTYGVDDMHTWWKVLKSACAAFAPCIDGLELYRPLVGADEGLWLRLLNNEVAWDTLHVEENCRE